MLIGLRSEENGDKIKFQSFKVREYLGVRFHWIIHGILIIISGDQIERAWRLVPS